ncbi:MAG: FAD-binding oxidoreductase [Natronospirillum sp.]|uniref:NAD(P)/FAD-dependent oxidoreductase n=1 Tax=Natronospirillum sp. TaxID=2812955 RepID=UPI0025E09ECE|nr:FAD-binding oxidoreductase [Natronospirillum sp.]MCH8553290.1 FAD-binding oxidoreductase [Natronospirillum sp.]
MSRTAHTASYYAASANPSPERPSLQDSIDTDVCIIGAGYTGLSTALHLAEAGYKVVVLEAARVGWGASGRNGGQLINSYSRDVDVIERHHGADTAKMLGSMAFEGADIIRQRIDQYKIDCDYRPGGIFAAFNRKQMQELEARHGLWASYGHDQTELLDTAATRARIHSDRYHGALLDHRSGHVHPLNLALGEAAAIESLGGQIFEDSRVTGIERKQRPVVTTASGGQVTADYLVIAGNAYLGGLVPELSARSMPCGTQIVATEPLGETRARDLITNLECVEDCNYKLDYYRITGDFRLVYGGGVSYGGGDPASIEAFLRPRLEKTFPQLKGVKLDYAWGGDFLLTVSRLPQVGRLTPSIFYAQGYSGHGVTTTHLIGRLMCEALKGQAERFDAFGSVRHMQFPGGRAFRKPYTALGAVFYELRDRLGV